MDTPTVRPKRDRRTQPRIPLRDIDDRDIIIHVERRDGIFLYVVTTAPGTDEFQLYTAEQAVAQALACARREHARAWFRGDNDCILLEDFREVERFRFDLA